MFYCLYMLGLDSKLQKGLFLWAKILLGISEEETTHLLGVSEEETTDKKGNQIWPNTLKLLKYVLKYC